MKHIDEGKSDAWKQARRMTMLERRNDLLEAKVKQLREVAAVVYGNWAGGEPVDEHMKELGKLLGFEVNIP